MLAFGPTGAPTADPSVALRGMLAPLGGVKGFALASLVNAMTREPVGRPCGPAPRICSRRIPRLCLNGSLSW
jgi:LDH2 family malate/lactate/ureidoglycolate dehydrogenase